jgi:hypothetical protein
MIIEFEEINVFAIDLDSVEGEELYTELKAVWGKNTLPSFVRIRREDGVIIEIKKG